jgi:6-phosphogluconolactonase (cycloisomerase 2 family)
MQHRFMNSPTLSRRSFLKVSGAFAGSAFLPSVSPAAEKGGALMAYVGTYSAPLKNVAKTQVDLPPGNGQGIHLFEMNRTTGALSPAGVLEMGSSPSCLVVGAAGAHLYSTNETDKMGEADPGSVSAFAIDRATGKLTLLNTVSSGGAGPTHASLHPSGKWLFVANYFGGSVSVFPIQPDGKLGPASDTKKDHGTVGPKTATSAKPGSFAFSGHDMPHAHQVRPDPSGRYVFSVDLGFDQILSWKFDSQAGKLTPNDPPAISLPPGDGPRHFDFHPNGRWFYSLQEEGSTVALFDYDAEHGRITYRKTISSLPPDYAGSNFCSEIAVSTNGKFVYCANRLHDSIAYFAVGENGELTYVGEEWTRGDYPRSFTFDPTETFLYSCNQRADHLTCFRVDREKGGLSFTGQYTPVGNPSIVVFLDLAKSPTR